MDGHVFIRNGTQHEIQSNQGQNEESRITRQPRGGRGLIAGRAITRGVDTLPRFQRTKASNRTKLDADIYGPGNCGS